MSSLGGESAFCVRLGFCALSFGVALIVPSLRVRAATEQATARVARATARDPGERG